MSEAEMRGVYEVYIDVKVKRRIKVYGGKKRMEQFKKLLLKF